MELMSRGTGSSSVAGVSRRSTDLRRLIQTYERFYFVDFGGADLADVDLRGRMFVACRFEGCDLAAADLAGAQFEHCVGGPGAEYERLLPVAEVCSALYVSPFANAAPVLPARWAVMCGLWMVSDNPVARGDVVDALRNFISEPFDRFVRAPDALDALDALGELRDPLLAVVLQQAGSSDRSHYGVMGIVDLLEAVSDQVLELCFELLRLPDAESRRRSLRTIDALENAFRVDERISVDVLLAILDDDAGSADLRCAALHTLRHWLGWMHEDRDARIARAIPTLRRLLEEDEDSVRIEVLRTIDGLHWPHIDVLAECVRKGTCAVRSAAYVTIYRQFMLAEMSDLLLEAPMPDAAAATIREEEMSYPHDDLHMINIDVVDALLARSDPGSRIRGLMLVGLTTDGASAARVAPSLSHPGPEVRRAAIDALAHLQPPPSIELLDEVLRDPDSGVREAAETAWRVLAGDEVDEPR